VLKREQEGKPRDLTLGNPKKRRPKETLARERRRPGRLSPL